MKFRSALVGLVAFGGMATLAGTASAAMPNGMPATKQVTNVDQVRWVCNGWGRCFWRPNVYGSYGFYGPRRFYGPRFHGGWHRGWRHRW